MPFLFTALFARALEGVDIKSLLTQVGSMAAAPTAAAPAAAAAAAGDSGGAPAAGKGKSPKQNFNFYIFFGWLLGFFSIH